MGRDKDGKVLYPYGTTRDTFWPPIPEDYVDSRTLLPNAVERAWWFNFEDGEITGSWVNREGMRIPHRAFRKWRLSPEQFELVKSIKEALDTRGVECCEDELRVVLREECEWIKREAESEIVEYQHYEAGIKVGQRVLFYPLPRGLQRLPTAIVGLRHLDSFPYNFGCRGVAPDWLGFPPAPTKKTEMGNYVFIRRKGVANMDRDELRAHLEVRGEQYARGELTRPALQEKLRLSIQKECDRRKVHWFCCANDKCRRLAKSITYDPNEFGHEMIPVGPFFIDAWDKAKGRAPREISVVYAHLREEHWQQLITFGYGTTVV